ncbi:MAG: glycerophosphodiester phosphodiesterase [Ignavibacteriae bacterium]|nr:glycerophosphodiester phosphodiesterase [Ignavibacteriota bacterium]NOG97632.1 glycerophosphodiester phosphodiesterase [Ignavibacteriota bacterium]
MKQLLLLITILLTLFACEMKKETIIVAHRGASGHAPENTLAAMKTAMEMNAEFSELDVQETKDGEIILLHDKTLKRTGKQNLNIWELNYDELKDIEVGGWYAEEFKGEPIPTLAEVIELVRGKMKLNIELKTNKHEKMLAERALQVVLDHNFLDQVVFTSFKFDEIRKLRKINKEAKVGYIFSKMPKDIDVFAEDVDMLSVGKKLVDEEFMNKVRAAGKEVAVWTVNKPKEMKRLINLGVDAIITNYPDVLREVLDGKQ